MRLFGGGGAHEDDFRLRGAVVAMALQLDQEGPQQRLELGEAFFAFEALVEAEGGEDDVRLVLGEVLVEVAKAIRPRAEGHFIGGPAEVAEDELLPGKALVHERLELPIVAHAIEERIPDEGDAGAGFQLQRQLGEGREGQKESEKKVLHEKDRGLSRVNGANRTSKPLLSIAGHKGPHHRTAPTISCSRAI